MRANNTFSSDDKSPSHFCTPSLGGAVLCFSVLFPSSFADLAFPLLLCPILCQTFPCTYQSILLVRGVVHGMLQKQAKEAMVSQELQIHDWREIKLPYQLNQHLDGSLLLVSLELQMGGGPRPKRGTIDCNLRP